MNEQSISNHNCFVSSDSIITVIETGKRVRSCALGRVGIVQEVFNDGWVLVKHHHRSGGVTRFDTGDPVELIEKDDEFLIQHPAWAWSFEQ